MQFHNLHVLVTCETQNFNDSCHFVWIFLFFVQIASEKAVDVTVSKTLQELHRGLSQKISTDSFLMLQPSPVGAANPGDAAPQAKTFSEAMEVLGAGAYPQYVRWILQISTNYKMNTYEYSWIQWILSAPVLFVLGLMHGSRRHPWNCQASTGLLAKDVVWEPSPASAKKTQSWHRQGGQNPVECAQKISMFGENGELPDVSSRKLSFLLPIHRQWRRPKKSWQILGQQVESQLVCHCSSLALVNPIHSAAMPPPVVCVGGGGDQECGRSIFSPINDEKMYFILLEEAIWLCLLYQQHDLGGCLSPRQKKHCNFHEISKQTSHFDERCPNEDMCSAQMLRGFGEIPSFCSYLLSNTYSGMMRKNDLGLDWTRRSLSTALRPSQTRRCMQTTKLT